MAENLNLFVTDIYDALGDIVRALGGPKKVGTELRPDKPWDEAAKWVKDCLNRDRREKFDADQMLWLLKKGREANCHSAINYICDECGYGRPPVIEPQTHLEKLLTEYVKAAEVLATLHPKIEEQKAKLRLA